MPALENDPPASGAPPITNDSTEAPSQEEPSPEPQLPPPSEPVHTGADKTVPIPQARMAPLAGGSLSLQNLEREFRQKQLAREVVELTIERVMEVWNDYAAGVDSPSLRQFLQDAEVRIQGERLHVIVGTQMARGMIQQDTALMSALRERLHQPMLGMMLEVDTSRAPVRETDDSGPSTPREIYEHLAAKNPLLHELRKRFDLSVD